MIKPGLRWSSGASGEPGHQSHYQGQHTQAQLREDVVRFAHSYFAVLSQAFDSVQREARSPEARLAVVEPKVKYCNALIDIALGPQPEANLLDMVVLATLLHDVMKDYWVPRGMRRQRTADARHDSKKANRKSGRQRGKLSRLSNNSRFPT